MSGSFHIHVPPNFQLSLSYFLTPLLISFSKTHSPITCLWPGVVAIHLHIYILIPGLNIDNPSLFFLSLNFPPFSFLSSIYFWLQEQLDVALSKTCKHFDVAHYTKVQLAYTLLGKTQVSGLTLLQSQWKWKKTWPQCPLVCCFHVLHM